MYASRIQETRITSQKNIPHGSWETNKLSDSDSMSEFKMLCKSQGSQLSSKVEDTMVYQKGRNGFLPVYFH